MFAASTPAPVKARNVARVFLAVNNLTGMIIISFVSYGII
jgi:hypothetical protein